MSSKADSLRIYYTTDAGPSRYQTDQSLSLGGFISKSELPANGFIFDENPPPALMVQQVSGLMLGFKLRAVDVDTILLIPDGADENNIISVPFTEGLSALVEGESANDWLRLLWEDGFDGWGATSFDAKAKCVIPHNTGLAPRDWNEEDEASEVRVTYRAFFIKNDSAQTVSNINFYLAQTTMVQDRALVNMDPANFEISLALETPAGDGTIQTVPNEITAPAGVVWSQPTSGSPLAVGSLAPGASVGLWVRHDRKQSFVSPSIRVRLTSTFDYNSVNYMARWRSGFRCRGTLTTPSTIGGLKLFRNVDADPDVTNPAHLITQLNFESVLPTTLMLPVPGAGTEEYRVLVLAENRYGQRSLNKYSRKFVIDSAGVLQYFLADPYGVTLLDVGGGYVQLSASWKPDSPDKLATHWLYHVRLDPSVPYELTSLIITEMEAKLNLGLTQRLLQVIFGPFPQGATVESQVNVGNVSGFAQNPAEASVVVGSRSVAAPRQLSVNTGIHSFINTRIDDIITEYANGAFFMVQRVGETELWRAGSPDVLLWRLVYDGAGSLRNGLWTYFAIDQVTGISLTQLVGDTVPLTNVAPDAGRFHSGNRRRLGWDESDRKWYTTGPISTGPNGILEFGVQGPLAYPTILGPLGFQVLDPDTFTFKTVMQLDADGTWRINGGLHQRTSSALFE